MRKKMTGHFLREIWGEEREGTKGEGKGNVQRGGWISGGFLRSTTNLLLGETRMLGIPLTPTQCPHSTPPPLPRPPSQTIHPGAPTGGTIPRDTHPRSPNGGPVQLGYFIPGSRPPPPQIINAAHPPPQHSDHLPPIRHPSAARGPR